MHLGGSAAPDGRGALYASYARFAVRAVVAAGLAERFGSVLVLGGPDALGAVDVGDLGGRLARATLAPDEARARTGQRRRPPPPPERELPPEEPLARSPPPLR